MTDWNRHFTNCLKFSVNSRIAWLHKLTLTYIPWFSLLLLCCVRFLPWKRRAHSSSKAWSDKYLKLLEVSKNPQKEMFKHVFFCEQDFVDALVWCIMRLSWNLFCIKLRLLSDLKPRDFRLRLEKFPIILLLNWLIRTIIQCQTQVTRFQVTMKTQFLTRDTLRKICSGTRHCTHTLVTSRVNAYRPTYTYINVFFVLKLSETYARKILPNGSFWGGSIDC